MKGVATLLLVDPDTRKVVKELAQQENYITDLFQQIANKVSSYGFCLGGNLVAAVSSLKFSDFTTGLLMFPTALPQQGSGFVLPRITDIPTGYADTAVYGGADMKRGSYNSQESGDITNGYRRVWDFGTGRAIGNVASVCLFGAPSSIGDWTNVNTSVEPTMDFLSDIFNAEFQNFNDYDVTDNFIVNSSRRVVKKLQDTIEYSKSLYVNHSNDAHITITLAAAPEGYNSTLSEHSVYKDHLYKLHYKYTNVGSGRTYDFCLDKYSLNTGELVSRTYYSVDLAEQISIIATGSSMAVNDNKIIWTHTASSDTFRSLDKNTEILSPEVSTGYVIQKIIPIKPNLFMTFSSGRIIVTDGINLLQYFKPNLGASPTLSLVNAAVYYDDPLLYSAIDTKVSTYIKTNRYFSIPSISLATVNNLSSVITKPADKVLKVIYDITW